MADIEAIEVLTQAKERLFECGWAVGAATFRTESPEVCLEEAVGGRRIYLSCLSRHDPQDAPKLRAAGFIRDAIGDWSPPSGSVDSTYGSLTGYTYSLYTWNDCQESAGSVFDAIDRAIEIAKEAPNPCSL